MGWGYKTHIIVVICSLVMGSLAHAQHNRRYREGELIVKLRSQPNGQAFHFATTRPMSIQAQAAFVQKAQNRKVRSLGNWSGLNMHHMRVEDPQKSVESAIDELKNLPEVEYAEPNYIVDKLDTGGPQSAAYTLTQVLSFIGSMSFGMTAASIQAPNTWPLMAGSNRTIVAIIDTGVDLQHPAFANALWINTGEIAGNGVDDDGNGYIDDRQGWNFAYNNNNPDDDEGHGTHVAGISLGVTEDIFHPPGVPSDIQIMPLKFLDSTGSGATSDAIKAIYYASNNGAKVLNNSWGGGNYSQALAEAITYAYYKDALFIAAAGNSSNNNDSSPSYPASYKIPNVVAVAATDDYDAMASFSNYGFQSVQLSSPGVGILSTYPGGLYAYLSGTSMAAPFVAGVAGMMRHESGTMNVYQIRQLLLSGVDVLPGLAGRVSTSGRLNVLNAVSLAQTTPVNPYKPEFFLTVNPADRGLASSISTRGGGCGLVATLGKGATDSDDQGLGAQAKRAIIMFSILALPLLLGLGLRSPEKPASRRRFERYHMDSSVKFTIGDQELMGQVRTISLGGSEINTSAMLKEGSVITMQITSPDGSTRLEVQGHIVWSESQKRYGVAFDNLASDVRQKIALWTKGLPKAS
ncbi:MAG: S8 family serine peptidase [Oligoflexia bacterium]|nr:S8 family serine peptidase [Oligoflexia bacterium]